MVSSDFSLAHGILTHFSNNNKSLSEGSANKTLFNLNDYS